MGTHSALSRFRGYQVAGSALLVIAGIGVGCSGENLAGPDAGTLEVISSTTGAEPDVDGYTLQIDAGAPQPLGPNATLRFPEVALGSHSVLLAGASTNCAVQGDNPRSINVTAGETVSLTFAVACGATTGSLRVTSTTTGSSPDTDGYAVIIDGSTHGALATNGETVVDGLTQGSHTVGIGGVAGNCQVEGDNPRSLPITAGSSAETGFTVTCQAPPPNSGTIYITTATSGPGVDIDGYTFTVDGDAEQPIGPNATAPINNLGAGTHSVRLSGIAEHCTLTGDNLRSVVVPGGGAVSVTFTLSCQASTGSIEVTTATSGPDPDTDGFVVAIDGGSSQPIGANAAVTIAGVQAGVRSVSLSGAAENCVVQGNNPETVSVTAGNTAAVTFTIVCTSRTGTGTIAITANPPVSALSGEVFDPAVQPAVEVKDGDNPAGGVEVTASLASGGGTLQGKVTATTNSSGLAKFGDLGIEGTGDHTLKFTAGTASVTSSPVTLSALPREATSGKWGPVVPWDIVPLHMTLLPTGKIFAWGKTDVADTMGMPRIWDPSASSPSTATEIHVDDMLFCAGHTLMPDGRLMVSGGHHKDDAGIKTTYFFSASSGAPQKGPDMANGRWYPTVTVLEDGRVLTMAGRNEAKTVVRTPEIWESGAWHELPGAGTLEIPYYPRNFVDPKNGLIFYASERVQSRWFDVDGTGAGGGRGRWTSGPSHSFGFNRDYGSAVMYDTGKILVVGGGGYLSWPTPDATTGTPTATAEVIDLNRVSPSWQSTASMANRRRHMNATVLPDGQVLATGGTSGGGFVNISEGNAVKAAELWNPETGQWTTLASNSVMRVYHSVSMLLPNGTVLHGASGDAMAGAVPVPPERSHEIFQPPYLFKGARPTITSAPTSVGYGETFSVATPNAAQITEVRWIRLGSVTHAFDAGQRANTLSFEINGGKVDVKAPMLPRQAPPGHYQLFILNRNGVPSAGKIIRVQ
ncbi:MAG TPA: galactose oxidase-like domain-containing protein [Gemmatimonadales bacterium]|nr:galactose oxidase-like domain-containing protein [Gemmatimonadales bacterium]